MRAVLDGTPVTEVASGQLKNGLGPPSLDAPEAGQGARAISAGTALVAQLASERVGASSKAIETLEQRISEISAAAGLAREIARRELTSLGLHLLDGDACPLCDFVWPPGDLEARLAERLRTADQGQSIHDDIRSSLQTLSSHATSLRSALMYFLEVASEKLGVATSASLADWGRRLEVLESGFGERTTDSTEELPPDIAANLAPAQLSRTLPELISDWQKGEEKAGPSPSQTAWDSLTRLEEHLSRLESEREELRRCERIQKMATQLTSAFQAAREEVLDRLYEDVRGRFVELYRSLHEDHEADFDAIMQPSETGVEFKVDFHGRGVHPPHALHSEGHQDSMGICLYFALAERLTKGLINLVVLDDVMMSVDIEHRRDLCRLLSSAFADKQLIVTTHDRTWAHQLRSERVVTGRDSVQFYGWDVSTGPRVSFAGDVWDEIEADLETGEVPTAGHRLRRSAEEYFASVCDALQAPVPFRLDAQHDLGDFAPAAINGSGGY